MIVWPKDGIFSIPKVSQKITGAKVLADPSVKLIVTQDDKGTTVSGLPTKAPDASASVIDLSY